MLPITGLSGNFSKLLENDPIQTSDDVAHATSIGKGIEKNISCARHSFEFKLLRNILTRQTPAHQSLCNDKANQLGPQRRRNGSASVDPRTSPLLHSPHPSFEGGETLVAQRLSGSATLGQGQQAG